MNLLKKFPLHILVFSIVLEKSISKNKRWVIFKIELRKQNGELVVDAYQGPVACLVLERHVGVCWAAIDTNQTQIVHDVHAFPGHIPCDDRSRSEVVVPVRDADGRPIGVFDIDSHKEAHFDGIDGDGYESIVKLLEERWNKGPSGA